MTECATEELQRRARKLWARFTPQELHADNKSHRKLVWSSALLLFFVLVLVTPRITKFQSQHIYADRRNFLGFPNTLNVLSTFPYLVIGCIGAVLCLSGNHFGFSSQGEVWGWASFFVGITTSAFGSAFYHLKPCDNRLVWDRLPMTIAFSAVVAVFMAERLQELKWPKSFVPFYIAGLISFTYWWLADEVQLVQFISSVAIPAMTIALPTKYTQSLYWMWAAGIYLLAKMAEVADVRVYKLTRYLVSGHTVKHLGAAMVPVFIMIMLAKRNVKIGRLTV